MAHPTLLEHVNSVLTKLRFEKVTSFDSSNLLQNTVIDLLNTAARDIFESRDWPFFINHDQQIYLPGAVTTGAAGTFNQNSTTASLELTLAPVASVAGGFRTRVVVTDGTTPNLAYRILNANPDAAPSTRLDLTLASRYRGTSVAGSAAWTSFCCEAILPASCRRVLSVRDENQPIRLNYDEKFINFDAWNPRPHDSINDNTSYVIFAGHGYNTSTSEAGIEDGTARIGPILFFWPPPSSAKVFWYSLIYQYEDDLTLATESWSLVPISVLNLVEWRAFEYALMSNVQNDPVRAGQVRSYVDRTLDKIFDGLKRDPLRRNVPQTFGSPRLRHPNWRWQTQEVPSP